MTMKEAWEYAFQKGFSYMQYLVEMLVLEKKVCDWNDDWEKAKPYLQDKYIPAVTKHLERYIERQG